MGDWTPDAKARAQAFWDRLDAGQRYPTGSWAQRWIPRVCAHDTVRCIHGDEIIARGFRRRLCMTCGRALKGDLPRICWFTRTPHPSIPEASRG